MSSLWSSLTTLLIIRIFSEQKSYLLLYKSQINVDYMAQCPPINSSRILLGVRIFGNTRLQIMSRLLNCDYSYPTCYTHSTIADFRVIESIFLG